MRGDLEQSIINAERSAWLRATDEASRPIRRRPERPRPGRPRGRSWLLRMLHEERVVAHFQPIVYADAPDTVFGYEALLRGRERDGTLVGPILLYEAARSAALLLPLDCLARLAAVRGAVASHLTTRLFINFTPLAFFDPASCVRSTMRAIAESGMAPERIVIELVESEEVEDMGRLRHVLDGYRSAGFQVALDDLGAGYSSLRRLTLLRPDFVKLDAELVRGVDADPYKAAIVTKLLEAADGLAIRTVAEAVETEAEWRWFREHHVHLVQGYLFARPGRRPPAPRPWTRGRTRGAGPRLGATGTRS